MIAINGYTLFPHPADWSTQPDNLEEWQSGIGTGVLANEQRSGLRDLPLESLAFVITAQSLQERCRLDARVDQASKSGVACVPYFGMGSALAASANAGDNAVQIQDAVNPWTWAAGDYAILIGADDTIYDVLPVTLVAGNTLEFGAGALNYGWVRKLVRPLLFGIFRSEKQNLLTDWHTPVKLTVKQQFNPREVQVGILPPQAPGVGQQIVGKTNQL